MNKFGSTDPHAVSIPSADITSMEVDRRCHIYVNGRELPECETYDWFEAAIHEKAAREQLDENGLARCGCGGVPVPYSWDETLFSGDTPCLDVTVECQKCGMGGNIWHESKLDAKNWWNAAMGWRAEE